MKPPARMDPEKVAGDLVVKLINAAVDRDAFSDRFIDDGGAGGDGDGAQGLEDDWRLILAEELGRLRLAPFLPTPASKPGRRPEVDLVHSDIDAMKHYAELCLRGPKRAWEVGFYYNDYSADLVQALAKAVIVLADVARGRIRVGPPGGRNAKRQRRARRVVNALEEVGGRLAPAGLMSRAKLKDRTALAGAIKWANSHLLDGRSIVRVKDSSPGRRVVAYELVSKPMSLPLPDGGDMMFDRAETE